MKKIYLRKINLGFGSNRIDVVNVDIKKDRAYWKKHHNVIPTYFSGLKKVK